MKTLLKIKSDLKESMINKDKERLTLLRTILGEINRVDSRELNEDRVLSILKKMRKNAEIMKNQYEIDVIDTYLPKSLTEDETKDIIKNIIDTNGFTQKDMGKIMKELKVNHKDVDMKLASIIIKNI